jgi:S1-C subfamily serine protease
VPTAFRRSTTDHWPTRIVKIDGQDVPLGGDIILSVEGISMLASEAPKLRDLLASLPTGKTFTVEILRAGRVLELTGRAP